MFEQLQKASIYIQSYYNPQPEIGIVLGTGLGKLAEEIEIEAVLDYDEIPYFPTSSVETHLGKLLLGKLAGKRVIVMSGRVHFYEGFTMEEVVFPLRVMKLLGVKQIFLSNAAGGLNPAFQMSDLMLIEDHIDMMKSNPLIGANIEELGTRFPDMSEPYDRNLLALARKVAKENNIKTHEGVYVGVTGPNLETRAEYRMLRMIGADVVGMSTIPEVIACCHMGVPVFAASVVTDLCDPNNLKPITLAEVIAAAEKAEPNLAILFKEMIRAL